jgi:hypothetical protein
VRFVGEPPERPVRAPNAPQSAARVGPSTSTSTSIRTSAPTSGPQRPRQAASDTYFEEACEIFEVEWNDEENWNEATA